MNSYQVTYVSHKYTFFACKNTSLLNFTASTAQIDSKATHGIHYAMCIVNSQLTISFATLTRHCRDCLFTQLMGTKTEKKPRSKTKKNAIGRLFQCQFHNGKCTAGMKVLTMEISFKKLSTTYLLEVNLNSLKIMSATAIRHRNTLQLLSNC